MGRYFCVREFLVHYSVLYPDLEYGVSQKVLEGSKYGCSANGLINHVYARTIQRTLLLSYSNVQAYTRKITMLLQCCRDGYKSQGSIAALSNTLSSAEHHHLPHLLTSQKTTTTRRQEYLKSPTQSTIIKTSCIHLASSSALLKSTE